jgi:hypothetical protein
MSAMMNDRGLLQAYVRDRSDLAFQELVRRHATLVYSCARQELGVDLGRTTRQGSGCLSCHHNPVMIMTP